MSINIETECRDKTVEIRLNSDVRNRKCIVLTFSQNDDHDNLSIELKHGSILQGLTDIKTYQDFYMHDGKIHQR
jgi:hypothetical protein